MKQLVVLKLKGELDKGFWLTVEIGAEGKYPETEITGELPPAQDLILEYKNWQSIYRKLEYSFRLKYRLDRSFRLKRDGKIHPIELVTESYIEKQKMRCYRSAERLKELLNKWLDSRGFRRIDRRLREQLHPDSEIRFLISTESRILKALPWHLWNILEAYPQAEIAVSSLEYKPSKTLRECGDRVRILAILGNSSGIDVQKDKEELLKQLPNAQITFLEEPEPKQLNDRLWEQSWDILFFAGHSKTEEQTGRIHINNKDSLTVEEIKSGLKKAIAKGLQLAIFNSCDGLGLVLELEKLDLPQMVVMREPVPDRVAHQFLNYFLPSFAKGVPLHLAVRSTRERLQGLEQEYPCASWLPAVFINPAVAPLTWSNLLGKPCVNTITYPPRYVKPEKIPVPQKQKSMAEIAKIGPVANEDSKPETAEEKATKTWNIIKNTLIGSTTFVFGLLVYEFIQYRIFTTQNTHQHPHTEATLDSNSTFSVKTQRSELPIQPPPQLDKTYDSFKDVDGVPRGTFNYGGSSTWKRISEKIDPEIKAVWPEFRLRYVKHPILAPSSSTGIEMILKHQLTMALSSRRLKPEEIQKAREHKFPLEQVPIAIDAVVFTVNPYLGIDRLTTAQLRDIYTGKITNWAQVGGPDLKITPYSKSPRSSGTALFFVKNILDRQKFSRDIILYSDTQKMLDRVASDRGAIFYASASEIIGQCRTKPIAIARSDSNEFISPYNSNLGCSARQQDSINLEAFRDASYPLTRYLYVVIEQNGNLETQAGQAYINLLLSDRGQELIKEAGFLPVR